MSILHTASNEAALQRCLRFIAAGDALLLIEDGVYLSRRPSDNSALSGVTLLALKDDLDARGLTLGPKGSVSAATMAGYVQLCCDYDKLINWF